jgi:Ca-activated chloride channel family protein
VTFLVAWRLWLLLAVGALTGAWLASLRRRRQDTIRFTNVALLDVVAPERPGWRRHLPAVLWLVALAVLILGFARPARDVRIGRDRATVLLAIDVSLSMEATDVDPSRLEVARDAAIDFVEEVPDEVDLGLVVFSGSATVAVAPTEDHEAVTTAIEDAELAEGTAIGEAIFAGLDAIADAPPADDGAPIPGRVVVLSDGETTQGRPNEEAAAAAAEASVPVDTIAFGTPDGTIEGPDGSEEPVPVAPEPLREIATATGGEFFEADSMDALTEVYQDISTEVGYETEERDVSAWFIGLGLVLLAAAGTLSLMWSQRLP